MCGGVFRAITKVFGGVLGGGDNGAAQRAAEQAAAQAKADADAKVAKIKSDADAQLKSLNDKQLADKSAQASLEQEAQSRGRSLLGSTGDEEYPDEATKKKKILLGA